MHLLSITHNTLDKEKVNFAYYKKAKWTNGYTLKCLRYPYPCVGKTKYI